MTDINATAATGDRGAATVADPLKAVLEHGRYLVVRDFPGVGETRAAVVACFRETLEELFGRTCADSVEQSGLGRLHESVPVRQLAELKRRVNERMKGSIHGLAVSAGRHVLGIEGDFWVSDLVITRIHYPFYDARAGTIEWTGSRVESSATPPLLERLGLKLKDIRAAAAKGIRLFDPTIMRLNAPIIARQMVAAGSFRAALRRSRFSPAIGIETSTIHGPHLDIWNGLPFDGVTLWWAINDVAQAAGLLLYPELFGMPAERSIESGAGQYVYGRVLPVPHRVGLRAGEMLLFSEDKMYHASHLNISGETRVVISTHLCLSEPRFCADTRFAFERFHGSSAVEAGSLSATRFAFRRSDPVPTTARLHGHAELSQPTELVLPWRIDNWAAEGADRVVCKSEVLPEKARCIIRFEDAELVLLRQNGRLFCLGALCPHRGYSLAFGGCDGTALHCPGHGVRFDLATGRSDCPALQLSTYAVVEEDGLVRIGRRLA